jgi:agmatine/peptidylarginine deiminase
MCRWIDKDTVLMNDFSLNRRLGERVFWRLRRAGPRVVRLRIAHAFYRREHDWAPYIKYLETPKALFVPTLGIPNEKQVIGQLRHIFHKKKIIPVLANKLIDDGVLLIA